jgi:hypothetical protein
VRVSFFSSFLPLASFLAVFTGFDFVVTVFRPISWLLLALESTPEGRWRWGGGLRTDARGRPPLLFSSGAREGKPAAKARDACLEFELLVEREGLFLLELFGRFELLSRL